MPPDPPRGNGPYSPFSGHSRLSHLQWPLVTNVIETPGISAFGCLVGNRKRVFTMTFVMHKSFKRWLTHGHDFLKNYIPSS